MKISIKTIYALQLLEKHKERHITAHTEAKKGWEEAIEKYSTELSKWATAGGVNKNRPKEPQQPVNYVKEYDSLIERLGCHQDTLIYLEERDFEQIVKDRFGWSHGFMLSNSTYLNDDSSRTYFGDTEDEN